jgi:hypothetical protein
MATARLGHADLLLRDHCVAWRALDLMDLAAAGPLPGNASDDPEQRSPPAGLAIMIVQQERRGGGNLSRIVTRSSHGCNIPLFKSVRRVARLLAAEVWSSSGGKRGGFVVTTFQGDRRKTKTNDT